MARDAPAGFVIACFYVNAAYILSNLVNDNSFIGVDKNHEDFKAKVREHVEHAKLMCHMALQHLQYVEDNFEIAKEDLKQRISITLAFLHLKFSFSSGPCDTDCASISNSDLQVIQAKISESETSLMTLKGTGRLDFNNLSTCCW